MFRRSLVQDIEDRLIVHIFKVGEERSKKELCCKQALSEKSVLSHFTEANVEGISTALMVEKEQEM